MDTCKFAIETALLLCVAACGVAPDGEGSTSGASVTDTTTSSEASASVSSSSATSTGTPDDSTTTSPTSTTTESSTDATASTSTGEAFAPEDCRAAVTDAECNSLSDLCYWGEAYRVLDVATCSLEPAPDLQCWSRYIDEVTGCAFPGTPDSCTESGKHPRYREVNGELQLLDHSCTIGPEEIDSDLPGWEVCPNEEMGPVHPVCDCLCGV